MHIAYETAAAYAVSLFVHHKVQFFHELGEVNITQGLDGEWNISLSNKSPKLETVARLIIETTKFVFTVAYTAQKSFLDTATPFDIAKAYLLYSLAVSATNPKDNMENEDFPKILN